MPFLVALGFELRTLHLLGRCSTTWATFLALSISVGFSDFWLSQWSENVHIHMFSYVLNLLRFSLMIYTWADLVFAHGGSGTEQYNLVSPYCLLVLSVIKRCVLLFSIMIAGLHIFLFKILLLLAEIFTVLLKWGL
jgi:hypothetical protein